MAEKKRGPGRPPGSKNKNKKENPTPKDNSTKIKEIQEKKHYDKKVLDEIWAITLFALGVFLVFTTQLNTTGAFGEQIHDVLKGLFGVMAYVLPYYFMVFAVLLFLQKMQHINWRTVLFSILIFLMMCNLNAYRFIDTKNLQYGLRDIARYYRFGVQGKQAGTVGMEFGSIIVKYFGAPGLLIISITVIAISILLVANNPISNSITKFKEKREEKKLLLELEKEQSINEKVDVAQSISKTGKDGTISINPKDIPTSSKKSIFPDQMDPFKSKSDLKKEIEENKKKNKIVEYLSDDDLLNDNKENSSVIETPNRIKNQDAVSMPDNSVPLGLDGTKHKQKEGFGLDGYVSDALQNRNIDGVKAKTRTSSKDINGKPSTSASNASKLGSGLGTATAAGAVAATVSRVQKKEQPSEEDRVAIEKEIEERNKAIDGYKLPSIELLKKPKNVQTSMSDYELEQKAALLEKTLNNFNVDAKVINVTQGASVTRYEVQPAIGVKVNKIVHLADDIALNLRAKSLRIEAPIPGKAAVGIEIENTKPSPVLIRELIASEEFLNEKSKIGFALGKDISGNNIVADLYGMPHMLIAGATGSGKSVCINTIIASFLYKARPDEVKLILIDPKVVELGHYNGIPHMLIPVVTDPKKAAAALNWAVNEMNKRYKTFADAGAKELMSYNEQMIANQEPEKTLPQVVIIIDELADLMLSAPSQVEESISRLTAKARAAGMHLIVATQRPSVDVVTGTIKNNIPSRIAFSVSSTFDSRTILDTGGAENLLGKGDMLFSPMGSNKQIRVQGAYISDTETAKIIEHVKKQAESNYNEEVIKTIEAPEKGEINDASDELTDDAIAFIIKKRQASVSMLQRRFRIGYNRAARIIDEIEARGIISASDGSRPRQVLVTEEEYYESENNGEDITDDE